MIQPSNARWKSWIISPLKSPCSAPTRLILAGSKSDAFGSIAYSNTTGTPYATIGAGEITVRGATAGFSLDALNRDPDNMQVITSQTSFAIEIPGINLKRWATQVKDSVNLIKAVTANVPDEIKAGGRQPEDGATDQRRV